MKSPHAIHSLRMVVVAATAASFAGCAGWFDRDSSPGSSASGASATGGGHGASSSTGNSRNMQADRQQSSVPSLAVSEDLVRAVQQQLRDKGMNAGPIDGIWGPETYQGLKNFQQSQGLQPSGQLDGATLQALGIPNAQGPTAASPARAGPQPSGMQGAGAPGASSAGSAAQGASATSSASKGASGSSTSRGASTAGSGSQASTPAMPSFQNLDANNDGEVSLAEAAVDTRVSSNFKRADQNGDNRLSRDEFQRALEMSGSQGASTQGSR